MGETVFNMKNFGLNDKQVEESKAKYGTNRLSEVAGETFMDKLKGNFDDPMIKILLVALVVNVVIFILGAVGLIEQAVEWYEPIGIAVAIALATLVSTFSEYRARYGKVYGAGVRKLVFGAPT